MTTHRGYRFRLYPTPEQEVLFRQFAGVCRLVYNLALEQRRDWWRHYERETGKKLNAVTQGPEITALRAEVDWIAAVPAVVQHQVLRDLDKAFANFFAGRAQYPIPRRKGEHDAFRFIASRCGPLRKINAKWSVIRLEKIGDVRVRTHRAVEGRALSITVSAEAGKWYASFGCEQEVAEPVPSIRPAVGIDRGVARTLTLSTGGVLALDRERLNLLDRRSRAADRKLSRCKRGSRRYAKARVRLARIKAKAARYRKDWNHKAAFNLAGRFGLVVLEDLRIKNMTASAAGTVEQPGRNVRAKAGLNRAILEHGWHQFETVLGYKLEARGGYLLKVDPAFTSQTCAACGTVDAASRQSQSVFVCVSCGHTANADHNGARNILHRGQSADAERGVGPALKREATARKSPKTLSQDGAQLSPEARDARRPTRKRKRTQSLAA
jgi:putative transposase